jgi:glycosyltransferase involved in cell wall biosynthesis
LAYLAPAPYAFVQKDIDGLRAAGATVHALFFRADTPWQLPWAWLRQCVSLLALRRRGVRIAVAHFAGFHTVLPILLGFRTHPIIAGADACSFPGIAYGSLRKPFMRSAIAFTLRRASAILPVHGSLARFTNTYSDLGPAQQGYAALVPGRLAPTVPIPYGFDASFWTRAASPDQREGAICVAMGAAPGNAIHFRKGVDLIAEAARALPEMPFTIIGASQPGSYTGLPSNIRIRGRVSPTELRDLYLSHSIYLQPSVMEGFPNALCEAMLCGCLPVVSDVTSMPAIAGATGAVIATRSAEALLAGIRGIKDQPEANIADARREARARIAAYTMERRMRELLRIIGSSHSEAGAE